MERRIVLTARERERLEREAARCSEARLRTRILIIVHSAERWSRGRIAAALRCDPATISRVRSRWTQAGREGLDDLRASNGRPKADDDYHQTVEWTLSMSPADFGLRRPTWTQPLLIDTAARYTGVRVSTTTMSRVLRALGARLGRPKPVAPCPWGDKARTARMAMIHRLIASLPPDQACVWEDEVDIDLNPKIGRDWMLPGMQRRVMTPGKNVKRYLAVALDARTDRLTWTSGRRKTTDLFLALLRRLLVKHADQKRVHVILDNYGIHTSAKAEAFLAAHPALRLHFLPPYDPDDNRVEREVCRELHANVTVNHQHEEIESLMGAVHGWLIGQDRRVMARSRLAI